MTSSRVSKEFFDAKYREKTDPWNFASSSYELYRYTEILRALGGRTFYSGLEPGCSIGVLTEQLASRCGRLLAMDISPTAVIKARRLCERYGNVDIREGALPHDLPQEDFDLIVFSEIGYYFDRKVLADVRDLLTERLVQNGVFVGAHWLGLSADHILAGDEVHEVLRATNSLRLTSSHRFDGFLLECWERI